MTVRSANPEDAAECGRICFEAFHAINTEHNFPPDIPEPERAVGILSMMFSHPGFYCVVAEVDGRIVGSNCVDERSSIAGIGPITIDPAEQNRGIGRRLMEAILERERERKAPGVRLVQAAFHNRSLCLYTRLGFDTREPLSVMTGPAIHKPVEGNTVRAAQEGDIAECNGVCLRVHGHDRGGDLADAVKHGSAVVTERHGRITGYATALAFFGHAVGEANEDVEALIAAADGFGGAGILAPTRNAALFRWCLENGLRVVEPLTLMTVGLYNEPKGAYLASIAF